MRTTKSIVLLTFVLLLSYAISLPVSSAQKLSTGLSKAIDSITETEGLSIISELASDKYEGRFTAQPGQLLAAEYIKTEFEKAGLKPYGGVNTYYQKFSVATNKILPTPVLEVQIGKTEFTKYDFGTNFVCRGFSGSGDITAEVVFCGYGISSTAYDDYVNVDVKDKIVLIISGHPVKSHYLYDWDPIGKKVNNAIKHGAKGMLIISSTDDGTYDSPIISGMWGDFEHRPNFPVVVIDRFIALDILTPSKQDLPILQQLINKQDMSMSFATGAIAHLKVEAEYNPLKETSNVVGILEGSDPRLKNEYIIVGAHMDHMGLQGADIICPGANDNASGVAGLIEIAKAFKDGGIKPKRSIIFVAFTAEEIGLKGSQHFVEKLPFDKKKVKFMVNLDMIGNGKDVLLFFGKQYPKQVTKIKTANNALHKMDLKVIDSGGGSDHASFVKAKIPAAMILAGGPNDYPYHHRHYHFREWMINIKNWKKIVDTTFLFTYYLANE